MVTLYRPSWRAQRVLFDINHGMATERAIDGAAIVVVGDLNPVIIHPEWFGEHELLTRDEVAAALEGHKVTHRDLSAFSIEWLLVQATPDRLVLSTADPSRFTTIGDLCDGIFALLEHTPVRQLGLNRDIHYRMGGPDPYQRLGEVLVPPPNWTGLVEEPRVGLLRVEGTLPGLAEEHRLRVTVEPSNRIPPYGVFVQVNEHHDLPDGARGSDVRQLVARRWRSLLDEGAKLAEAVIAKAAE